MFPIKLQFLAFPLNPTDFHILEKINLNGFGGVSSEEVNITHAFNSSLFRNYFDFEMVEMNIEATSELVQCTSQFFSASFQFRLLGKTSMRKSSLK
ncbi:MAG: hypothetical protein ACJAWV_002347 [Flammeovirgaceae bacterium]